VENRENLIHLLSKIELFSDYKKMKVYTQDESLRKYAGLTEGEG
jgi:hypothetical protein